MASSNKFSTTAAARRKSSKASLVITLKLSSKALQKFAHSVFAKGDTPTNKAPSITPHQAHTQVQSTATSSDGQNPFDSSSNTPVQASTPVSSSMPPPTEVMKKKAVKRTVTVALGPDGLPLPKVRGKPGPKKKARLEDGTIDHSTATIPRAPTGATSKLGPKANQGAINAGLRALDRSGKPCRRWAKGSFKLKSFTGVTWEIPRWTAPPKLTSNNASEDSASGDSSKENKETSQMESEKSEKSNTGVEMEIGSTHNQSVSSPVPSGLPVSTADTIDTPMASVPVVTASA